jgi:hypothetical protein
MKNNPVTTALLGALIVVAALTVYFLLNFNLSYRELRQLQPRLLAFQNNRLILQSLANDLNEYSKKQPAIDPLLIQYSLKAGISNPPASTPQKPAAK